MAETIHLFAQQAVPSDIVSQLFIYGPMGIALFWIKKFAFPSLLDRNDKNQIEARQHFERILDKIESNRANAAKDGHDAARQLSKAITEQCEAIRGTSQALDRLSVKVEHGD